MSPISHYDGYNGSLEMASYAQLESVASKVRMICESHPEFQRISFQRGGKQGNSNLSIRVERVLLKPGRREVSVKLVFADGQELEAMVDVDNELVYFAKSAK